MKYLSTTNKECWIWHKKQGHASIKLISKLVKLDLIEDFPNIKFEKDKMCDAC